MKIKVAIVDDQYPLIQSLSEALSFFDNVEVVFTARNGKDCLEKLASNLTDPEVILMDIEMDVMNGIEATSKVAAQYPHIKIIILSAFDQDEKIFHAILAGANGYLLKGERPTKIVGAIEEAIEGRLPMSPLVASKSLALMRKAPSPSASTPETYKLSPRETEVLEHVASGLTYNNIAEKLFLSPKTVRNHIENIYKKLEVHSKVEAVQIALKNNWFNQ
ncbi:MAG: response regulator transcription factor [Bacteroidota bacterium]